MKRVIPFSNARFVFFAFSILLFIAGMTGFLLNKGLNLGVDFKAGIALQFQVAPASFDVQYNGPDRAEISIPAGEQALTAEGNVIITVTSAADGTEQSYPFNYSSFASVRDLAAAMEKVSGVTVSSVGDMNALPTDLIPLTRPQDITGRPAFINLSPGAGRGVTTDLAEMRTVLAPLGQVALQVVGAPANQEFIARLEAKSGVSNFQTVTENSLTSTLEAKYGDGQVILKSTNFIGQRVAQSLGGQAIWLVIVALLLIMIYMMFRFRPPIFAIAAVIAVLHDAVVMIGFNAVFRVEVTAATIAAILTILGYSINDTIVIFDRVRENKNLLRGATLRTMLDTSVTQTLGRTFITSGATMLTVISLFALTSGDVRIFSLNMIVGIVEGTYSTFIGSFIVLSWSNFADKRRKAREIERFGAGAATAPGKLAAGKPVSAALGPAEPVEAEDAQEPEAVPGAFATEAQLESGTPVGAEPGQTVPADGQPAQPQAAPLAARQAAPQPNVLTFPGSQGSRKHKKHRRRHH